MCKVKNTLRDEFDYFKKWNKNSNMADKQRMLLGIGNQHGKGGAGGFGHGRLFRKKDCNQSIGLKTNPTFRKYYHDLNLSVGNTR